MSLSVLGEPIEKDLNLLRVLAIIKGNTVTGLGPTAAAPNYGIWIGTGVAAEVTANTLMNHFYTGNALNFSGAIQAYDTSAATFPPFRPLKPLRFFFNSFSNNSGAITLIGANDAQIMSNKVIGASGWVAGAKWFGTAVSGTNVAIANNTFCDLPIGIALLGRESFGNGWPETILAANPTLTSNWFCNVGEHVRIAPDVIGVVEVGSELCRPKFESITKTAGGNIWLLLRDWQGHSWVLESSTNLVDWAPIRTNTMGLPLLLYEEGSTSAYQFYRAKRE